MGLDTKTYWLTDWLSGVRLGPLGTAATSGLLYQLQMIDEDDCGANDGMKVGRGNRSTQRKTSPVSVCPPQIPHDQTRARIRAAAFITKYLFNLLTLSLLSNGFAASEWVKKRIHIKSGVRTVNRCVRCHKFGTRRLWRWRMVSAVIFVKNISVATSEKQEEHRRGSSFPPAWEMAHLPSSAIIHASYASTYIFILGFSEQNINTATITFQRHTVSYRGGMVLHLYCRCTRSN
jgi:hypothetical protein